MPGYFQRPDHLPPYLTYKVLSTGGVAFRFRLEPSFDPPTILGNPYLVVLRQRCHNEAGLATARVDCCGDHPNSARTEGGRDENYRMRFTRSPANAGDAGHGN